MIDFLAQVVATIVGIAVAAGVFFIALWPLWLSIAAIKFIAG
jgi:hypothetical protein